MENFKCNYCGFERSLSVVKSSPIWEPSACPFEKKQTAKWVIAHEDPLNKVIKDDKTKKCITPNCFSDLIKDPACYEICGDYTPAT